MYYLVFSSSSFEFEWMFLVKLWFNHSFFSDYLG